MDLERTTGYIAKEKQRERLEERRKTTLVTATVCGLNFEIHNGVYQTAKDTELMAKVVNINSFETFLEIGCGCGAISIILAKKSKKGLGVDINQKAVDNSKLNAQMHNVDNVSFVLGNLFEGIEDKYDVILFNPPYSSFDAKDKIDMMFWDPKNLSKTNFFKNAKKYLKLGGRIYFGWADFDDLDKDLPLRLAKENALTVKQVYTQKVENKPYTYIVYELV